MRVCETVAARVFCTRLLILASAGANAGRRMRGARSAQRVLSLAVLLPAAAAIAVEPESSQVIAGGAPGPHPIQGIGAGFIPDNLDTELLDGIIAVGNDDALGMARRMAKEEGILCGISSGAAVTAAIRYAETDGADDDIIVVIIPSFGERYIQTALFDPYRYEGSDDLDL